MPDPSMIPPGVPTDEYGDFLQNQRKQAIAAALMQQASQPIQQPESYGAGPYHVQPRLGWAPGVSKIATALLANRANSSAMSSNAQMLQNLNQAYAPGGQPDGQGGTTPQNPRNPLGLPADAVRVLAQTAPDKYAQMLQGPEAVQVGRLAGLSTPQSAGGVYTKQNTLEIRPGQTAVDPVTKLPMVGADVGKGEWYSVGPDGHSLQAHPITDNATIQAWNAGAQNAAVQSTTPRTLELGGGRTTTGLLPVPAPAPPPLLAAPTGQAPAAPPAAGAPTGAATPSAGGTAPGAGPTPSPGGPAAGAAAPGPSGPPASGGTAAPAGSSIVPAGTPMHPQHGVPAAPIGQAWQTIPKINVPNTPNQSSDAYTMGKLEDAAKARTELTTTLGSQAQAANQTLELNKEAMAALPSAEVGPLSAWLTGNRSALLQMGVPANLIPEAGTVTPTLELNKALTNAALQGAKNTFGSRMTQNEVKLQTEEMSPSAEMTRDAIASLINQSNVKAKYVLQQGQDFQRYDKMGGDPTQFNSWYSSARPLTRFATIQNIPPQQLQAAMQRLQNPNGYTSPQGKTYTQQQLLSDFKATYGFDPTN
jgi:hypothetical protein